MGARSSKPPPRKIEPEVTAVEVFQDPTPEAPRDASNHKRQKGSSPAQGGTTHVVRAIGQSADQPQANGTDAANTKNGQTQDDSQKERQKKKRKRSKKDKSKPESSPKLVRAQTQLNELKNVKPLLQQSPQARQQHFEQIKDAYALDEEAKKAPATDSRSRFFNFENWRKTPQTPTGTSDAPPLTRSQTATVPRALFASSGRSSRGTEEISNGIDDYDRTLALDDIESIPLPAAVSRTSAITSPISAVTPSFLAATTQTDYGRPDIQTTPVIRVKTSDRRTPDRVKRSVRSDLRLDDVDEDLMEHILTDDDH